MTARTFILDQNFPEIAIKVRMPEAQLVALRDVDPWLTHDVEDWTVLAALHQRGDIHGFISCDEKMLHVPKVLAVLQQTQLTLLVCAETGHDAIAATGLMLLHLPAVARGWVSRPQLYVVRQATREDDLDVRIQKVERAAKLTASQFQRLRLSTQELQKPIKEWYLLQALPMERPAQENGNG